MGGARYVQWNMALYDDEVLWVVPYSHNRLNTAKENAQLATDDCAPLPGSIQVKLAAGDVEALKAEADKVVDETLNASRPKRDRRPRDVVDV